jgi:hypothetical protein
MRYAALIPGCAALVLAACTDTYHVNTQIGATPALLTTADLRVVTDRPVPNDPINLNRRAVCTEPPPDVAKALSTALSLSAKANVPSGAGGQGSLDSQTVEQAMELAGRVPGVIALRDGTYRLCEAWSNGAVGDSAYALALARYGEVLVTLMLGDDMTAATRSPPGKLTGQLSLTQNNNGGGSNTANTGATQPAKTPAAPTGASAPVVGQIGTAAKAAPVQLASLDWPLQMATAATPVAPVTPATPPKKAAVTPAAPAPAPAGTDGNSSASDAGVVATAQALGQMQLNYMTLSAAGPLIVACIASGDQTTPIHPDNTVLTKEICQTLLSNYAGGIQDLLANASSKSAAAAPPTTPPLPRR